MEGQIVNGWDYKVRVYPPLPSVETCVVKFLRTSQPKDMDSTMEKWNFQKGAWVTVRRGEVDTLLNAYTLLMPVEVLKTFSVEMLKGALRAENV